MLDSSGLALACPLSRHLREINKINNLGKIREIPMLRRKVTRSEIRDFPFWG